MRAIVMTVVVFLSLVSGCGAGVDSGPTGGGQAGGSLSPFGGGPVGGGQPAAGGTAGGDAGGGQGGGGVQAGGGSATLPSDGGTTTSSQGTLIFFTAGKLTALGLPGSTTVSLALSPSVSHLFSYGPGVIFNTNLDTTYPQTLDIELMRFDGTNFSTAGHVPSFTVNGNLFTAPRFAPDGKRFVLTTHESASATAPFVYWLSVYNPMLARTRRVANLWYPTWLSADTIVAGGADGLYTLSRDGVEAPAPFGPRLGDWPKMLALSPDGQWLAFVYRDAVHRISRDGQTVEQLTLQHAGVQWPTWSPDSSALLLQSTNCTVGSSSSPVVVLSATRPMQDVTTASRLRSVFSCQPMDWR